MGYSSRTLSAYCNTGSSSLPTGYVEVPDISVGSAMKYVWAMPPSGTIDKNCTTGEPLDPGCWNALNLDSYVTWWWENFQHTCDGDAFAKCFFRAMTPYTGADYSILNTNSPCQAPQWTDFKDTWNGVESFSVAVSIFLLTAFLLSHLADFLLASTIYMPSTISS
jgi:hypothetical protein